MQTSMCNEQMLQDYKAVEVGTHPRALTVYFTSMLTHCLLRQLKTAQQRIIKPFSVFPPFLIFCFLILPSAVTADESAVYLDG